MGKGSGTAKKGINKKPQRLSDNEAPGGSAGGAIGGAGGNACLLRFTSTIKLVSSTLRVRIGQPVVLIQGTESSLDVMSGGIKIGSFNGEEQPLIEECMANGYVYKGVIETVNAGTVTCLVKGYGVQNEPANNS